MSGSGKPKLDLSSTVDPRGGITDCHVAVRNVYGPFYVYVLLELDRWGIDALERVLKAVRVPERERKRLVRAVRKKEELDFEADPWSERRLFSVDVGWHRDAPVRLSAELSEQGTKSFSYDVRIDGFHVSVTHAVQGASAVTRTLKSLEDVLGIAKLEEQLDDVERQLRFMCRCMDGETLAGMPYRATVLTRSGLRLSFGFAGSFNYHPTHFVELADRRGYETVDFCYSGPEPLRYQDVVTRMCRWLPSYCWKELNDAIYRSLAFTGTITKGVTRWQSAE